MGPRVKSYPPATAAALTVRPQLLRYEANRLEQALVNLLGNAMDAMKDAPIKRLSISAGAVDGVAGKRVLVQISDSGGGIDAGLLPRLFESFSPLNRPVKVLDWAW